MLGLQRQRKRGEKNEKEEMKQMMKTVHFLKIAHERDGEKIDKLSEMMEELLLRGAALHETNVHRPPFFVLVVSKNRKTRSTDDSWYLY